MTDLRLDVEGAAVGVRVAGRGRVGTGTGPARDVDAEPRVAVEAVQTPVAVEVGRRVATLEALAGARVAQVGVAVALAALARREVPVACRW